MGRLGLDTGADGEIVFLFLLAQIETGVLAVYLVGNIAGVFDVLHIVSAHTFIIGILDGGILAVIVRIVCLEVEILAEGFGV